MICLNVMLTVILCFSFSFNFYTGDDLINHTFNNLNIRSLNNNYYELYSFLHCLNVLMCLYCLKYGPPT